MKNSFLCLDCKKDTCELDEYYMLKDNIWREANPRIKGMLCLDCVERRLKRKLHKKDFLPFQMNFNQARKCYKLWKILITGEK